MAGKSYKGPRPVDRYGDACEMADLWMMQQGYQACKFQPPHDPELGAVVRLYTMDVSRSTKDGGISIAWAKDELMKPTWTQYVKFQIETALQRKI